MKKHVFIFAFLSNLLLILSAAWVQAEPFAYVGARYHTRVGDGWNEPEQQIDGYYLYDLDGNQQIGSVMLGDPLISILWYGIALNATGTELYLGSVAGSGKIGVVDLPSNQLVTTIQVDERLGIRNIFYNRDGRRVYIYGDSGEFNHDHLFQVDSQTHQIVSQVDLNGPLGLGVVYAVAYDSQNDRILVLHEGTPAAISILQPDFTLDRMIDLDLPENLGSPREIVMSPDGRRAYLSFNVSHEDQTGEVDVVEINTGRILNRIPLENSALFLRLNHAGTRLVVLDYNGIFTIINTENNEIAFHQRTDLNLLGSMDISPDDRKLLMGFDTLDNDGGLMVFDFETEESVQWVVPGQPWSVVFDNTESENQEADLRIALRGDPEPVNVGGRLTYTVTVHNDGDGNARDVRVRLVIPNRFSFVQGEAVQINPPVNGDNPCQFNNLTMTCDGFNIRRGADLTIGVVAQAPRNLNKDAEFFEVAALVRSSGSVDPNPNNNLVGIRTNVHDRNWWFRQMIMRDFNRRNRYKLPFDWSERFPQPQQYRWR